jgi:hypothetical protein
MKTNRDHGVQSDVGIRDVQIRGVAHIRGDPSGGIPGDVRGEKKSVQNVRDHVLHPYNKILKSEHYKVTYHPSLWPWSSPKNSNLYGLIVVNSPCS